LEPPADRSTPDDLVNEYLDGVAACVFGEQFSVQSLYIRVVYLSCFAMIYLLAHISHGKRQL
jgi:hypothetical protein